MKKYTVMMALTLLLLTFVSCSYNGAETDIKSTSDTVAVSDEDNKAYIRREGDYIQSGDRQPVLIAHAGGAVYGMRYTNSLDALDCSYSNGYRYMELDFEKTSDGKIVLLHDWEAMGVRIFGAEGRKTLEDFLSADTLSDLKVMDVSALGEWLREHGDAYIITDVKNDNISVLEILKAELGEGFERIIPQVYSFEEFAEAKALGCERIIFTSYASSYTLDELLGFAEENKPWGITVKEAELTEELASGMNTLGIPVYAHTVNDLGTFEKWYGKCFFGIYTDYFTPNRFPYENQ